jgi:hypothetical protein
VLIDLLSVKQKENYKAYRIGHGIWDIIAVYSLHEYT